MAKYVFMAAAACSAGYFISLFTGNLFTANITLYMGSAEKNILNKFIPAMGAGLIFITVMAFCRIVLRRFQNISVVEAIRTGNSLDGSIARQGLVLHKSRFPDVNIFLGAREVVRRFGVYWPLCIVFTICIFLMIVPLNTLNTVSSPNFVSYMGAGHSDIRIDMQNTGDMEKRYNSMIEYLQNDNGVEKYAAFITGAFKAPGSDGGYENIKIETGDFTIFPLEYLSGTEPAVENEIALSVMNAGEFQKRAGDLMTVLINGEERDLIVCGIYQDVTNGGKTAKAILPYDFTNVLWFTVNLNLINSADIQAKIDEYTIAFYPAKITEMENYVNQSLGGIISQLRMSAGFAVAISIGMAILITAMFFKMLSAKDRMQISIMMSIGFTTRDIHTQYASRALLILLIGIVFGTLGGATLGQGLASLIIPGISSMKFVVNPLTAYILCPVSLILAVIITMRLISVANKKTSVFIIPAE
jgi:putative ABC transport system permease protein